MFYLIKREVWAEINLNNIKDNLAAIRETLKDTTKICCVVKADAYGHGAVEVSKKLIEENIDYLAVARLEEAIELRKNNIEIPILCLGYICKADLNIAIENNITMTVYSSDIAKYIDKYTVIVMLFSRAISKPAPHI